MSISRKLGERYFEHWRAAHPDGTVIERDLMRPAIRRALSFMGIKNLASLLAGGSLGVNRGEVKLEEHVAQFEQAIAAMVPA